MSHNQRIRPPGMWTPNSALLAAEVELFDEAQYLEIHEGGGTWALLSNTVIGAVGNASWTFTLPVVVNDISGHVVTGKTLWVDPGATLSLGGTEQVQPGGAIRVLGQQGTPGTVEIGQNAALIVDSGGTVTMAAGSTLDIFGGTVFETGASWRLAPGALGTVNGGATIYLVGTTANTPAQLIYQQNALEVFMATTGCQFQGGSFLTVLPGAALNLQGALNCQLGSTITGTTTLVSGATLTVAGTTNFAANSVLNLLANCTVNFVGTAQLLGSPVFLDSLLLGQAAKATFYTGSTFADGSVRTYTAPQIPWGPDAVDGMATPIIGPIPPAGQTYVDVDLSGMALINTPQNLAHEVGWTLTVPSHPEVARMVLIRQVDPTKQGFGLGIWFQNALLGSLRVTTNTPTTSAVVMLWDTTAWTFAFSVGPNAFQGG